MMPKIGDIIKIKGWDNVGKIFGTNEYDEQIWFSCKVKFKAAIQIVDLCEEDIEEILTKEEYPEYYL